MAWANMEKQTSGGMLIDYILPFSDDQIECVLISRVHKNIIFILLCAQNGLLGLL